MTDGDALLAAVLANPDDDTPRLVYADWLQEHSCDARAEFIRVQVELARLPVVLRAKKLVASFRVTPELPNASPPAPPPTPEEVRSEELRRRSDELSAARGDRWVPPGLVGRVMFRWERGFVAEVRACEAADWLREADALLAHHPVRKVVLATRPDPDRLEFLISERRAHRLLLPRGNGRHNAKWYAFWENPDLSRALDALWPGVEFELPRPVSGTHGTVSIGGGPPVPVTGWSINPPAAPAPPADLTTFAWAIDRRRRDFEVSALGGGTRSAEGPWEAFLEAEAPAGAVGPGDIGRRFGPVEAADRGGRRWRCEAYLDGAEHRLDRGVTRLTARAAGPLTALL